MDSNETILEEGTSTDNGQEQNTQKIEINWELVDIEELKKGYLRQSDYTKKTQELAKQKESISKEVDPDDVAAEKYLQEKGYVKKDEILSEVERRLKSEKDSYYLDKLIEANPNLKQHENAIKKIAEVDNSALDDIIVKYNFLSSDKLSKAKQRDIVWGWLPKEEAKVDIDNMTSEQFQARKAKNGIVLDNWLSKTKTF